MMDERQLLTQMIKVQATLMHLGPENELTVLIHRTLDFAIAGDEVMSEETGYRLFPPTVLDDWIEKADMLHRLLLKWRAQQ